MHVRNPAVAGKFYPSDKRALLVQLSEFIVNVPEKIPAKGVIAPHAGYIYSGRTAGLLYSNVHIPETVIVLCPDHHGLGQYPASLSKYDSWLTPIGEVSVNRILSDEIHRKLKGFCEYDDAPHHYEHSIEVHLPFLKYLRSDVSIVPISTSLRAASEMSSLADAISMVISETAADVLIIASSDMTHYEPHEAAKKKDTLALERVLSLDSDGLIDVCRNNRITMCGVVPAAVMIKAALKLGAGKAGLIDYSTSGDYSGDYAQVVGYAGVAIF